MDLVDQLYWNSSYSTLNLFVANDIVTHWLDHYIVPANGEVFEIGCYPGRYLAHIGNKGWIVNGMDLAPQTESQLKNWLNTLGIKTNEIIKGDILQYLKTTKKQYDFVCSFGFIEHFENFLEIIRLHDNIVKSEGKLIITVPNFRGWVQRWLHSCVDKENLKRHYLPSMNPRLWKIELERLGYDIIFAGYFGNFDFWVDNQKRNLLQKKIIKFIQFIQPGLKNICNCSAYAPYCGIVAQKK